MRTDKRHQAIILVAYIVGYFLLFLLVQKLLKNRASNAGVIIENKEARFLWFTVYKSNLQSSEQVHLEKTPEMSNSW